MRYRIFPLWIASSLCLYPLCCEPSLEDDCDLINEGMELLCRQEAVAVMDVMQKVLHQWNLYQEEEARHRAAMQSINSQSYPS